MTTKGNLRLGQLVFAFVSILAFNSCHSDYLNLSIKPDGLISWNSDSAAFAFTAKTELFRKPVGIAKFPDGGMPDYIYEDYSIFVYEVHSKKLRRLVVLNGDSGACRLGGLRLTDAALFYKCKKDNGGTKVYRINLSDLHKSAVDTHKTKIVFSYRRFSASLYDAYLSQLKFADWGLHINDMYPQSKNMYMDYIIERTGNETMRRAIYEQIVPGFSAEDKTNILEEIEKKRLALLKDYETTDNETDVYQKSLKKENYFTYIEHIKEVKKRFNIQDKSDQLSEQKKAIKRLQNYGINIPDDLKFKRVRFIGKDYEAEFELIQADSARINTYIKWFRNHVARLLGHKWSISKQTEFEKPNSSGIVVNNQIHFNWEHSQLEQREKNNRHYLDLAISYNAAKQKGRTLFLTFSAEETIEE